MAGSYPTVEMMGDHIYRVRDCCFVIDTFQFVQDYSPDIRAKWWEAYKYLRELMEDPNRSVQVMIVLWINNIFNNITLMITSELLSFLSKLISPRNCIYYENSD